MNCPNCGAVGTLTHEARPFVYEYKGQQTTIPEVTGDWCSACGEVTASGDEASRLMKAMVAFNQAVNAKNSVPHFIERVRRALGLTQAEASRKFGGGPNAFSRYETGRTTPPKSLIQAFRLLATRPELLAELTEEVDLNAVEVGVAATQEESLAASAAAVAAPPRGHSERGSMFHVIKAAMDSLVVTCTPILNKNLMYALQVKHGFRGEVTDDLHRFLPRNRERDCTVYEGNAQMKAFDVFPQHAYRSAVAFFESAQSGIQGVIKDKSGPHAADLGEAMLMYTSQQGKVSARHSVTQSSTADIEPSTSDWRSENQA